MKQDNLFKIEKLIKEKKIDEAQNELMKLGRNYDNNADYLYLRAKVFYLNKLYYAAIDALLIALEFGQDDKIYNLVAEIYGILGNYELKKKFFNKNERLETSKFLKDQLTGIYRK
tara:strand:+ start:415 stop:759 length:345 start_codon:yes stop_codon:yes gene_type:complete